ncbi:MAG: four helix bundle protein [Candidatus Poribacteria bacterium]|nr:four helix bundle protein [Candidatus Poribacteria bacterium]
MQSFKKLQVWEKSHNLTLKIYGGTSHFPREEIYGLTSQIRRASASIPTNIAEGCGRESSADFARFLQIAMGSASETEYLILLAHDLKYLTTDQYDVLMDTTIRVKKMLTALIKNVRMNSRPAPTTDNR